MLRAPQNKIGTRVDKLTISRITIFASINHSFLRLVNFRIVNDRLYSVYQTQMLRTSNGKLRKSDGLLRKSDG